MKAKEKIVMKYVLSVLLACAMVTPLVSQRVRVDPPQKHHVSKKTESKSEKCSVKDCKCVCHKKDAHKKSDRKGSRKDSKKGSRRGSQRGRSGRGTRSRRSRSSGRVDAEYESKLRERLKGAVKSGKIKKEQAERLLRDRFGRKEAKKDTDRRGQRLNINSNERKQWGEILKRRLQGNRHYTDSKK